jgi:hypothetical protein
MAVESTAADARLAQLLAALEAAANGDSSVRIPEKSHLPESCVAASWCASRAWSGARGA